jgi:hypothetical protein
MATVPRSVSLAVFRAHIENGLSVAIGVGVTGLGAGWRWASMPASRPPPARCVFPSATAPIPCARKSGSWDFAFLSACFFTALSSFSRFHPPVFLAAVAFTGSVGRA